MGSPHTARAALVTEGADDHHHREAELLEALRSGRVEAVARAFDLWHERVRVLARRLLWDHAAAEDVVQEVFVGLPGAVRRFRGQASLETFLLAMAVKRVRHHQRAAFRRRRALERLADEAPHAVRDPEHNAYRRELGHRLAVALNTLPLFQRVAFVLSEIEGVTAAEAAVIADSSEATMRTRLFHARRRLRDALAGDHKE